MSLSTLRRTAAAATLALVVPAVAQSPAPVAPASIDDAFLTPVHTMPDTPDYGVWAAGPDYKASFHGGFCFVPVLGADRPHNLPLQWDTVAVELGGTELRSGAAALSWSDWRAERRAGAVVERYDVRREGVEQSFVIEALPFGATGDLVVRGRIRSPLAAVPTTGPESAGGGELLFRDHAGEAIVGYGEAVAFDAGGARTAVRRRYDGEQLELIVPAAFVADARLPLTIDPLIRTVTVTSSGGQVATCDVARDDEYDRLMVVYTRATSASDHDMWARLLRDDLSTLGNAFYDVTSNWSNQRGSVAAVGGANCFAVAHERTFTDASAITVYLHDTSSTTANSGRVALLAPPSNRADFAPTIGGAPAFTSGRRAFIAFRSDPVITTPRNTPDSAIRGAVLDCALARFVVTDMPLADVAGIDTEHPCINRGYVHTGTADWMVVWQERTDRANEAWRIRGVRVRSDGSRGTVRSFGTTVGGSVHNLRPKVAGLGGEYAVFWTDRVNSHFYTGGRGHRVRMQRFRWLDGAPHGIAGSPRTVVEDSYAAFDLGLGRAADYDSLTESHWAIGWRHTTIGLEIARVGWDHAVAERALLMADHPSYGAGHDPAVCFDDDHRRFPVIWRSDGSLSAVRASGLEYPSGALVQTVAGGCRGTMQAITTGGSPPYAGSGDFRVQMTGGLADTGATLFAAARLAATPIPLPLSNGCALLLDPQGALFPVRSGVADGAGTYRTELPIPSAAGPADIYWQVVQFGGQGLTSSGGLFTAIR